MMMTSERILYGYTVERTAEGVTIRLPYTADGQDELPITTDELRKLLAFALTGEEPPDPNAAKVQQGRDFAAFLNSLLQ
jgi:hypothetical protein